MDNHGGLSDRVEVEFIMVSDKSNFVVPVSRPVPLTEREKAEGWRFRKRVVTYGPWLDVETQ